VERGEADLLGRLWFPVARLQDVQPGPAQAVLLGRELVVFGGPAQVTVADGWCPHRGMKLSMGEVVEGTLQCPYHGWRYEPSSGRCVAIPSLPANLPVTRVCLKTYPVHIAYGLVWSCLGEPYLRPPQIPELDTDWLPDPEPGMPAYRVGEWTIALGEPADVGCGIRALSENFRDMSHFAFVHRASMGPDVRREVDEYEVEKSGRTLRYRLSSHPEGVVIGDGATAAPAEQPARDGKTPMAAAAFGRTNEYTIVLPSSTYIFSHLPGGGRRFIAQFVAPASDDGLRSRLFWSVGVDDDTRFRYGVGVRDAHDFDAQIFREDIEIVENCNPREQPLDPRQQVHTRADAYGIAYRRAYRSLLDDFNRGPAAARRGTAEMAGR
jgi:phenylpropionate dioxygenase-like ring-hydroxylating dioxygenase large terminal subunit